MNLRVVIVLFLFFLYFQAKPQFFSMGTDADSIKYSIRRGQVIQLVFPNSFTADEEFYRYLDSARRVVNINYDVTSRRIEVLLHTKTLLSNGFVAWAPSRSELFTIPARDIYPGYWPAQLAFHEMRHYMQMRAAHQSIGKLYTTLLGEQVTAVAVGLLIPSWYMEGDAVVSETTFLNSGRGRSPEFSSALFSKLSVLKRIPGYDKWLLGSMNEYYPNQYVFGYWMVNTAYRQQFGGKISRVFENAVGMRNSLAPFSGNFNKEMWIRLPYFSRQTFSDLQDSVKNDLALRTYTPYTRLITPGEYANYRIVGKGFGSNVIAYKTSLHGEPCIVEIDKDGHEKVFEYIGQIHDESFAMAGNTLVYSSYRPDARRELSDRTALYRWDIGDGTYQILNNRKALIAPAFSNDRSRLAVVEYLQDGRYVILCMDAESKKIIAADTFSYTMQPIQVEFVGHDSLLAVFQTETDRSLCLITENGAEPKILLNSKSADIKNPCFYKGEVYFEATFSGNNEIWRYTLNEKTLKCITSTKFGASGPKIINDTLFFSLADEHGAYPVFTYPVAEATPQNSWQFMYNCANIVSCQWLNETDAPMTEPKESMPEKMPYGKSSHLFRIHSWGPLTVDPVSQNIGFGFQINSQNLLNTMSVMGYSGYSFTLGMLSSGIKMSYEGWYPKISLAYINEMTHENRSFQKSFHSMDATVSLPLKFVNRDWYFFSEPAVIVRPGYSLKTGEVKNDSLIITNHRYWRYGLQYAAVAQRYTNSRNIFPKGGAYIGIYGFIQEFDGILGNLAGVKGGIWLPGIFRHDGFRVRGGYESRNASAFPYTSLVYGVRPYNIIDYPVRSYIAADYSVPVLYPDLALLGSLLYIKRVTAGVSSDAGFYNNKSLRTLGLHAGINFHVLRIYAPLSILMSWYYLQNEQRWQFQTGFGVDLYSY